MRSQGERICFVTFALEVKKYVCMPGALHLRHLCERIQFGISQHVGRFNPVNGYLFSVVSGSGVRVYFLCKNTKKLKH